MLSNQKSFVATYTVISPIVISVGFAPARKVIFVTEPPELEILVDREPLRTPATLDLWKRILVFGVAFGTAKRLIDSGRIPAPVLESTNAVSKRLASGRARRLVGRVE